jgi:hypothetical protein
MNEQQLAAVKQALEALKRADSRDGYLTYITEIEALQSIISQDALYKMAEDAVTIGLSYNDWPKIGCVNHDCDQCKAVQEPVAYLVTGPYEKRPFPDLNSANAYCSGLNKGWGERVYTVSSLYTTPPAPQPVPVKTYHDGKPWPVAPKPWVALTKDDVESWDLPVNPTVFEFVQFIEAKVKEKNHG